MVYKSYTMPVDHIGAQIWSSYGILASNLGRMTALTG